MDNTYNIDFIARCIAGHNKTDIAKLKENSDIIDAKLKELSDALELAALGIKYRGAVDYYADLPLDAEIGDAYTVKYSGDSGTTPDGTEYVWGNVGGSEQWIDFSKDSYTKAEVDALLSGLQTILSATNKLNPAYINYDSTHRAVSDTEKAAWNSKQSALTAAQLAAVNSGITSEDVAQIETNKNNISLAYGGIVRKNLLKENTVTFTGVNRDIATIPVKGEMVISLASVVSSDTDASTCIIIIYATDNSTIATKTLSRGVAWNSTFSTGDKTLGRISVYSSDTYVHGSGDTATYTDMMICLKSIYNNDPTYQPYAMSNAELTAAIQALQAQFANQ